jgi:hypothetical protein
VPEPEIIAMPGNPLVIGHAPRARTISAAFLAGFNDHFHEEGKDIFSVIYNKFPVFLGTDHAGQSDEDRGGFRWRL